MFTQRKMMRSTQALRHAQRGVVLIVALIFLLLITILALAASGRSLLQERMAGGLLNSQQARMSAETAVRGAEYTLWSVTSKVGGSLNCLSGTLSTQGCITYDPTSPAYAANGIVTQFQTSLTWLPVSVNLIDYKGPTGAGYTTSPYATGALASDPQYQIEDLGRELPPGAGNQHESGDTGPNNNGSGQVDVHVYRITGRGQGGSPNSLSVVQTTFDAQANN